MELKSDQAVIAIKGLKNYLGGNWVHKDLNLTVNPGEIFAVVGGSGSGKTTLLRCILMLQQPTAGSIKVCGNDVLNLTPAQAFKVRRLWGVMFQQGALFSSLTVLENVMFPLRVFTDLPKTMQEKIALLKISLVGLPLDAATKYSAQLSGGMIKRAALARAIALDPDILFLDEPTSGLDPKSALELDDLIVSLRDGLGLTVVVVTHDAELLWRISDRVGFLGEGKLLAASPIATLVKDPHPLIQQYFSSIVPAAEKISEK